MRLMARSRVGRLWRVWCRALGEKADPGDDRLSDQVAMVRTFLVVVALGTNVLIAVNIVKGWME